MAISFQDQFERAASLLDLLRTHGFTIATAESCTGGGVAHRLTAVPGSSDVVLGGIVSYANAAKQNLLDVSEENLETFGAVSEAVAKEMAEGACHAFGSHCALSTTGIAGPGGSAFKPEGRVCFGFTVNGNTMTESIDFGALGRENVRDAAIFHGLARMSDILSDL